jgi:hypothetical protein
MHAVLTSILAGSVEKREQNVLNARALFRRNLWEVIHDTAIRLCVPLMG